MLYERALLRNILESLDTADEAQWDDRLEFGNQCLYEIRPSSPRYQPKTAALAMDEQWLRQDGPNNYSPGPLLGGFDGFWFYEQQFQGFDAQILFRPSVPKNPA